MTSLSLSNYQQAQQKYRYLLNNIDNLDEKIYTEILNVPFIEINKKISSPFRKDAHPSFQFRYMLMEDTFASFSETDKVYREILCSVDYKGWSFTSGTYAIPISLIAWYYNLYNEKNKINFVAVIDLLYKKLKIKNNLYLKDNESTELKTKLLKKDEEKTEKKEHDFQLELILLKEDIILPKDFSEKDLLFWKEECNADLNLLSISNIIKAKKLWKGYKLYYDIEKDKESCFIYLSQNNKIKAYIPKIDKMKWSSNHTKDDICLSNLLPIFNKETIYNKGKKLIIQKATKEALLFYSLYDELNYDSAIINSESTFFSEKIFKSLVDYYGKENIIYIGDNDKPGINFCEKIKEKYNIKTVYLLDKNFKNTTDIWKHFYKTLSYKESVYKMCELINTLIDSSVTYNLKKTTFTNLQNRILKYGFY